ncbi:tachykinin-like peptides receptor 86C isoform X2 [Cephus cinctus]|uniref:Tachykinin-like peptides receptor 86C isoform X2 n=1 Tax=Cephus cinctus TaxID=211228 RepID=A0AAJ7RE42_CEPCN|nr:tachykinin-like peptides receptor 86C isoform X2 [Cephus cinctus]
MNGIDSLRLYNCSAIVLQRNITFLVDLNRSELLNILKEALDNSIRKEFFQDILSDCLLPRQRRPFDLPWWQKLSWASIFASMLLVAIGGNAIVMWIVLAHRRMRTVTNYFLVNLSLSDLMMAILNCVFNFIFMVNSDWPFGVVYCTVNNFVANVTVASSVFTLMAISLDRLSIRQLSSMITCQSAAWSSLEGTARLSAIRWSRDFNIMVYQGITCSTLYNLVQKYLAKYHLRYMAIMRPLQHHMSRRRARLALALIWFASALLALPCLLYSTTFTRRYSNGQSRNVCYMLWPDGRYPNSMMEYIYNLVFLGVTYLIPVTAMGICYTLMGRELWGSRSIGEHTQHQKESMKSKRRVVRMFIVVVTIFAVCWLPYHGYFIFSYHNRRFTESSYAQHIYLSFYWLAMSNAMVNPIIYYWMNTRFRVYFQQIICKCYCLFGRQHVRRSQAQDLMKHNRSDLVPSHSGRLRFASNQWRHSSAESHLQTIRMNCRSTTDRRHHTDYEIAKSD